VVKGVARAKLIWDPAKQVAFDALKDALTSAPVLAAPEVSNREFELHGDASNLRLAVCCPKGRAMEVCV
jgi:hypothetical protein